MLREGALCGRKSRIGVDLLNYKAPSNRCDITAKRSFSPRWPYGEEKLRNTPERRYSCSNPVLTWTSLVAHSWVGISRPIHDELSAQPRSHRSDQALEKRPADGRTEECAAAAAALNTIQTAPTQIDANSIAFMVRITEEPSPSVFPSKGKDHVLVPVVAVC